MNSLSYLPLEEIEEESKYELKSEISLSKMDQNDSSEEEEHEFFSTFKKEEFEEQRKLVESDIRALVLMSLMSSLLQSTQSSSFERRTGPKQTIKRKKRGLGL